MGLRDLEGCRQGLRCFKSLRSKIKSRIWMDIIRVIIIPSAGLKVEPALRHGLPSLRSLRRAASESHVPRPGQRAVDSNGRVMTRIRISLSCRPGRTSSTSGARRRFRLLAAPAAGSAAWPSRRQGSTAVCRQRAAGLGNCRYFLM